MKLRPDEMADPVNSSRIMDRNRIIQILFVLESFLGPRAPFRYSFSLRWLLLGIGVFAIGFSIISQVGMGTAEFTIIENGLERNEQNLIEGVLTWDYQGTQHDGEHPWPFECKIRNIPTAEILRIKPGTRSIIHYRETEMGPLKAQDPFAMYITKVLGLPQSSIVGYAILEDSTEVYIDGNN